MPYRIAYHPEVRDDLARINTSMKKRLKTAIESRLMTAPENYGEPLRKTLKGYWKLRVEDYRIVYKIAGVELLVFGIIHRKTVYGEIPRRL
ncbi:MAG: type II toxin-antitoxin system RelE/ParE family toxin [Nitrospinae bacterium]|nr:type II toxin-antitoxin system RelE/ParE family toxin [Nitrospinota bacterium]